MKNIHVLPTHKPSRLFIDNDDKKLRLYKESMVSEYALNQNIYITSEEDITIKNYFMAGGGIYRCLSSAKVGDLSIDKYPKKIILTTDQNLIKDGVQAINDEFLEWFVKNPSCEDVVVKSEILYEHKDTYRPYPSDCKNLSKTKVNYYLSTIPKEEPKQETLKRHDNTVLQDEINYWYNRTGSLTSENIVRRAYSLGLTGSYRFCYSEEEVKTMYRSLWAGNSFDFDSSYEMESSFKHDFNLWFEQFKKKK